MITVSRSLQRKWASITSTEDEWKVVRRIIHASADFELGRSVIITQERLKRALSQFLQDVTLLQMCK